MLYYLRCFLIAIYLFLVGAVGILVCLARPFHPDNTRWFARIYSWGGAAILGIKIRRHNYGSLKDIGPCVYVPESVMTVHETVFWPIVLKK